MKSVKPRVLIIDGDVQLARALEEMLEAGGAYATRVVHCAADAVISATAYPPAIAFLDIDLPNASAFAVARLFHEQPQLRQTRLIALTASIEFPEREAARAAGFERYLVKPVTVIELHKVLRRRTSIAA
jgi:CheY-like chemotaxis protein